MFFVWTGDGIPTNVHFFLCTGLYPDDPGALLLVLSRDALDVPGIPRGLSRDFTLGHLTTFSMGTQKRVRTLRPIIAA